MPFGEYQAVYEHRRLRSLSTQKIIVVSI